MSNDSFSFDLSHCTLCPRRCGADRTGGRRGLCGMGAAPVVARAAAHYWEEPCISGERGSGAVFFSGCPLHCVYCQNHVISSGGQGRELSAAQLRAVAERLAASGVHNINLVSPTHFSHVVAELLEKPLPVPVVYNCGGYERVEILRALEGKIQIWLPDLKYMDGALAARCSAAPDYPETAQAAIREMFRQTGPYALDEDGILRSGVVIRHLILPGETANAKAVIDWVGETFAPGEVLFSLMAQYTPCGRAAEYPPLDRRLTPEEYEEVRDYLMNSAVEDGFFQEPDAAGEEYIPAFDLTGLDELP